MIKLEEETDKETYAGINLAIFSFQAICSSIKIE